MVCEAQRNENFDLYCLQQGRHYDPFVLLGCHAVDQQWEVRVWLPCAKTAQIVDGPRLHRIAKSSLFTAQLSAQEKEALPCHYEVEWHDQQGEMYRRVCPYTFEPQIGELDLHLFAEGRHWNLYQVLGAQLRQIDGIEGVQFGVWAPSAERVAVVGDFNGWNGQCHPMRSRGRSGVWELFIPGVHVNDRYKFDIRTMHDGYCVLKADPYAQSMEMRPRTASIICQSTHQWQDDTWLDARRHFDWQHAPISIYEVHLGSWQRDENNRFLNYREIAHRLVDYVTWMGYNYINLMPVSEHPLDESWGYQTSGYYAPTRRFGDPDDFRYFVDYCHQHNIGVYLDWVPAHFPKDSFALARFDGTALYEHEDPRLGEHSEWGTYIFNYGRNEVRNFLIANALYWVREFHLDGLRVDAVASMLYLDYGRNDGDWLANEHGGNENLAAVEFIKTLNTEVHAQFPGVVLMAEESTSWPMVSRPTWMGGLGFSMKWNMGWMNDTLAYFSRDALHRSHHHGQLTFSQIYAYSENFILPLSHDEVVHLKRSLVAKMPGDHWQQLANVRLLLAYQMTHPGKKLLFMGGEFGQWDEWNDASPLDWALCDHPNHRALQQFVRQLNQLYFSEKSLHRYDFDSHGFEWIDCHDNESSTLSFIRQADGQQLICVFNFTPVVREGYRIGLPRTGRYAVRLNSDDTRYGGSGVGPAEEITAVNQPYMGQMASVLLTLPPLAMLVLKWEEQS